MEVDYFDGHGLVGLVIAALVDGRVGTPSDPVGQPIRVLLDALPGAQSCDDRRCGSPLFKLTIH